MGKHKKITKRSNSIRGSTVPRQRCRPSKTVVLAIRGSNSYEDLITDLIDRPVDVRDWVPEDLKEVSDWVRHGGLVFLFAQIHASR